MVYTFDVTVDEGMQGKFIVNTAVLHDGEDTTPLPDAGVQIDEGEVEPIVSKSANVSEAKVGDTISYKITVKNGEHATAPWKNIVAYDTLPAGVKLVGNVYLDDKVALHKLSGNALSVLVGDLAAGESMTVTFDVQVLDTAAGTTLQNSVNVSGDNGSGTATDVILCGVLATSALLLFGLFWITKNLWVVLYGGILAVALLVWGGVFLYYFEKKLTLFTDSLCRTLDDMMDSAARPEMDYEAETLLARISHRLERLYNVMQKSRDTIEKEKADLQS